MITEQLLDRLDAEHEQLIQPREFDKELRRLARLGLGLQDGSIKILGLSVTQVKELKSFYERATGKSPYDNVLQRCECSVCVAHDETLAQLPKQGEE